jgi:putative DNA primase/helicase
MLAVADRLVSPAGERFTDAANAERLVQVHGATLCYVDPWRRWLVWDGRRWAPDAVRVIDANAKDTLRQFVAEANALTDERERHTRIEHALRSESVGRLEGMVKLAREALAKPPGAFDRDPWLLNVENGTVALKTGTLQPHERADLLTKLAPVAYDPVAACPRWEGFLLEIMGGDAGLAGYLRRVVGYTLTGDVRHHVFFLLYGTGANGKSTFLETLRALLGDYAVKAAFDTFLATKSAERGIRNDIRRLAGARMVTAIEAEEGRRFDEPLLKELTGGDTVAARFLYQEHAEFIPQLKLFLAANHKPQVWGTEHAFWRRIREVDFPVTFDGAQRDEGLRDTLHAELPGILNWAVRGCQEWLAAHDLGEPERVTAATRAYQAAQDVVGRFLSDCTTSGDRVATKPLYEAYMRWAEEAGADVLSARRFKDRLHERGLQDYKSNGARYWRKLELRDAVAVRPVDKGGIGPDHDMRTALAGGA